MLTFDLESKAACFTLMNGLKVIRRSTNLQDNKSLIIRPYSTIFSEYSDQEKKLMGLRETTLRLSLGIEEIEDLKDDISQALSQTS